MARGIDLEYDPLMRPELPPDEAESFELPIDGVLDLHTFAPNDVKELVGDYLEECAKRHVLEVRIIHGKGTGALKRIVHSVLEKSELVVSFRTADEHEGGWGATLVTLRPPRQVR
jgi:DNA-nicking Smr family endonuclease